MSAKPSTIDQAKNAFTDDTFLGGRVVVRQPTTGYRAAIDPVLLAAGVQAKAGQRVLDAGCGSGAAMFCLAARISGLKLTGLELQPELAAFAREGVALNSLSQENVRIVEGDISAVPEDFKNVFDVVVTNPPFGEIGNAPPNESLCVAHMEGEVDLQSWISACLACLKQKGRFIVIHRGDRLTDVIRALYGRAGDVHIYPIFSKAGAPARRVIVNAGKGRRSPDTVLPGMVVHRHDGRFTEEAERVLRDANPLFT